MTKEQQYSLVRIEVLLEHLLVNFASDKSERTKGMPLDELTTKYLLKSVDDTVKRLLDERNSS